MSPSRELKEHCMEVFQDPLNQYVVEGDSFLDCIIIGDKMGVATTSWSQNGNP